MAISSLGFTAYTASGLLMSHCDDQNLEDGICSKSATYAIVLIAAVLCGLGAANIWVAI